MIFKPHQNFNCWVTALLLGCASYALAAPGDEALTAARTAYQEKRYAQALTLFQPLAQQEDPEAQFFLGVLLCEGLGVTPDCFAGAKWYWQAATQGHIYAQYNLGVLHSTGRGVPKDPAAAVHWWKKAASQKFAKAQFNLGLAYLEAQGVTQDAGQAEYWWLQAAEQGYVPAQYNLASLYQQGLVTGTPDLAQARHWFEQAAAQNDPHAKTALAQLAVPKAGAQAKPATTPETTTKVKTTEPAKTKPEPKPAAQKPDTTPKVAEAPGLSWLRKQPAGHYTVQLASESSLARAQQFAATHKLKQTMIVKLGTDKRPIYALLSGSYPTKAAAELALRKLPPALQQRKPWPRQFAALRGKS